MNKRGFAKLGIRRRSIDALLSPSRNSACIDRRTFLIGAAAAVALQSPTARVAARTLSASVRAQRGPKGDVQSVTVGGIGQNRWTTSVANYDGSPRLTVDERDKETVITLEEALLPGTDFRFDFVARVFFGLLSRRIEVEFTHAGVNGARFALRGDLDRWLAGEEDLKGDLSAEQMGRLTGALSPKCSVSASTAGRVSLHPDGVLSVSGPAMVETLQLTEPTSAWSLRIQRDGALLCGAKKPFTELRASLAEDSKAPIHFTFRTGWTVEGERSGPADLRVEIHPGGSCAAVISGGAAVAVAKAQRQLELGLANVNLAYADCGDGAVEGVIANMDGAGCWLHSPGCGVELGPIAGADRFVLLENGKSSATDISIAARRIALKVDDAVVSSPDQPFAVALSADPQLRGDRSGNVQIKPRVVDPQIRKPGVPQIRIKPNRVIGTLNLPTRIDVVRREDMLALSFEFVNMSYDVGGQRAVKSDPNKPSYMIVTFPPQSVAEKTFFENETGGPVPGDLPPVPARISGHTRLVFFVPASVPYILFSLKGEDGKGAKGLLDWSRLTLSVVPTAFSAFGSGSIRIDPSFVHPADKTILKPGQIFKGFDFSLPDIKGDAVPPERSEAKPGGVARVLGGLLGSQRRRTDPGSSANASLPDVQARKGGLKDLIPSVPRGVNPALTYRFVPRDRIPVVDNPLYTCIEMPVRLVISPNEQQGWVHTANLATSPTSKRTELWHTRLANRSGDSLVEGQKMAIRAVDAVDYEKNLGELFGASPFDQAMMRQDRIDLVQNMVYRDTREDSQPFWADRLFLTPLGGYLRGEGNWEWTYVPTKRLSHLITWAHNATLGRDHFVKIVTRGYLFPTGHPAAQVSISERKIANTSAGPVAYLRKRTFVVVRVPTVTFSEAEQRQMGFRSITMLTKETPPLTPDADVPGTNNGSLGFWTLISTGPFAMQVQAEDCDGRKVQWSMPLIYLDQSKATDPAFISSLIAYYEKAFAGPDDPKHPRRHRAFGQKMAFAPAGDGSESTSYPVEELFLSAVATPKPPGDQDRGAYRCVLKCAKVKIAAAEYLAGTNAPPPIEVELPETYKSRGFGPANPAKAFLQITKNMPAEGVGLAFGDASKSGGLVKPDQKITAFLRGRGPVGGKLADALSGAANPKDFLPDTAKILGAVSLWELLPSSIPLTPGDPKDPKTLKSPRLELKVDKDKDGKPQKARVEFAWRPEIRSWPSSNPIFVVKKPWSTSYFPLELLGKVEVDLKSGGESTYEFTGTLRNFDIDCIAPASFLILHFDELKFTARSGEGASVTMVPDFPKTTFTGPLTFVQKFQDLIGKVTGQSEMLASMEPGLARLEDFEFTPYMDVTPQMIRAGFKLGVPTLAFGAFTVMDIALSAEVQLPLLGDSLRVRFAFCERSSPFRLSVMGFAGGGFMSIVLSPTGIELLEASFEFGGSLALDIGVASGGVSVMAGIYFKMAGDDCLLEGFIRMNGRLSVLGIVRVSVEFYLALSYESSTGSAVGTARVTVEIEVLFFSASVSMTVQRRIAGSSGSAELMASNENALALALDARFTKTMSEQQWKDRYCEAFA